MSSQLPAQSFTRADEMRSRARGLTSGKANNHTAAATGSKQPGCDWETEYQFGCRDKILFITVSCSIVRSAYRIICFHFPLLLSGPDRGNAAAVSWRCTSQHFIPSRKLSKDIILRPQDNDLVKFQLKMISPFFPRKASPASSSTYLRFASLNIPR